MKILRSTSTFFPHVTGPAYQAYKVSEGLEDRGHRSPIVTANAIPDEEEPGFPPEMEEGDSFPFNVIRRKPLFKFDQYQFPPQAVYDYFSESPDVIHCHGYQSALKDVFYLGNLLDSKPFIIHGHGSFSKKNDPTIERSFQFKLYNKLWFRTVERADAIVVSTEQEYEDAVSFGVEEDKIWTIPVGKEPSVYTSVPRTPPDDHMRLLFVGRLAPRRNVELLIDAMADLNQEDVELRIVGGEGTLSDSSKEGYTAFLQKRAKQKGVIDSIVFTGPKYGDNLIEEYRNAHLFVNPTHYENFGQANLEAAFAGLPLVATPTGVALDLVDDSRTGHLFENKSELVELLSKLVDNQGTIDDMSDEILTLAKQEYTWDQILEQYCKLYDDVLA